MTDTSPPLRPVRADDDAPGAWRRNPYVFMLIAIPASVVLMAAVMIPLSISSYDGVVTDDYYKRGLLIGREMARDDRANELGLAATARLDTVIGRVTVELTGTLPADGSEPSLALAHATRGGNDAVVTLRHEGGAVYSGALPPLAPGRWYAELGGESWRLKGETMQPGGSAMRLAPVKQRP